MIDPEAVARLEAGLRDARGRNGDVAVVYAPDLASLIEDRKRLREALGRYAMHEGHCNYYLKVALCTCGLARALEGGQAPGMSPEALTRPGWE